MVSKGFPNVTTSGRQYNIGEKSSVILFVIPSILDVRFVDAPAGVTQEEDHTGYTPR